MQVKFKDQGPIFSQVFLKIVDLLKSGVPEGIINLINDEVEWLEEPEGSEAELSIEVAELVEAASRFYDREMKRYGEE